MSIEAFAHCGQLEDVAQRLKEILTPDKVAELASLLEGAQTRRQSGMEHQHERWILATLNFLAGMDIPVWNHDPKTGVRLKHDKEIPERLQLVREKFATQAKQLGVAVKEADEKRQLIKLQEECIRAIAAELEALQEHQEHSSKARETCVRIDAIVDTAMQGIDPDRTPHQYGLPDDRGVTRHTIDAREVVLRLGMGRIVHECAKDERICGTCLGLGLLKCDQPYSTGERKPREDAFPYHHQWIAPCHNCYMGKVQFCLHCKKDLPRSNLHCQCTAAVAERAVEAAAKEAERRTRLPRVKIEDYKGEMLWVDDTDRYITLDEVEDVLEEHPDATFFACESTSSLMVPDAADIVCNMQEHATSNANPEDGDDVLDFTKEAEAELDAFLKTWSEKHVSARTLWYPDMDTIVEVTRPEAPPLDPAGS